MSEAETLAAPVLPDSVLLESREGGVLTLVKNNPEANYGISVAMWRALGEAFTRAVADDSVRAIVIDAAGPGFHRGAVMVTEMAPTMADLTEADFRELVRRGQELGRQIAACPKPVIGVARGGALGGGLEMLMRCDFVYTLADAQFLWPEVNLGFVAAWGGTQFGARMVAMRKVQEMLLLGLPVSGTRAEEIGLVTRAFADADELAAYVANVLRRLEFCSPAAYAGTKQCLAASWEQALAHGEPVEVETEVTALASGDFLKAYTAFRGGQGRWNYHTGQVEEMPPFV